MWGLAAALGLSALLPASQVAYDVIRITGAAVAGLDGSAGAWQAPRVGGRGGPDTAFSVIWGVVDLVWLAGRMGGVLRRQSVRRRMEQISGAVLVGLGLRLAAES
ncbi:hypothetical protein AB4212_13150 [Streptomyces sp. 2MCAF27]